MYATSALSFINGLILARQWSDNKPKINIHPVHPHVYQWWFKLPDKSIDGTIIRRFGFLIYLGANNTGNKACTINSWRAIIKNHNSRFKDKYIQLYPMNLPEVNMPISEDKIKVIPIWGQKTPNFSHSSRIEPFDSTSGMIYYCYEVYGSNSWDPIIDKNNQVNITIEMDNVSGNTSKCKIKTKYKDLSYIQNCFEGSTFPVNL